MIYVCLPFRMHLLQNHKRPNPVCVQYNRERKCTLWQRNSYFGKLGSVYWSPTEEQPFLTTRHRHTTAEQSLQVGSVVPILLLLKGLWDDNFAIAIKKRNVILALIKFQFGTVARFLFTNHQIWHSVIYDFAQVCIFFNQTSHCYF